MISMTKLGSPSSRQVLLVLWSLVVGMTGCLMELEPEVGDVRAGLCRPEDTDPNTVVSFKDDIQPIFEREEGPGCGCHLSTAPRAIGIEVSGLDLTDHRSLMRGGDQTRGTIVVAGDPCTSVILQKVSAGPPFGSRMPSSGPPFLSTEDRRLLSDWIAEGARDN